MRFAERSRNFFGEDVEAGEVARAERGHDRNVPMDVLCTDKTGTLTQDRIILKRHLDIRSDDCDRVRGISQRYVRWLDSGDAVLAWSLCEPNAGRRSCAG